MPRTASRPARRSALPAPGATCSAIAPMPASILTLIAGIERHDAGAPAAIAFRSALRRKGLEADEAGGLAVLDGLMDAVAAEDPIRADARTAIIRAAWAGLLGREVAL